MTDQKSSLGVYKAIANVQAAIAKEGISKSRKNTQQNYNFRGIDDVYNALCGLLADNGLCIMPRFSEPERGERQTKGGAVLFTAVLKGEFDFIAVEDGSLHTVTVYGEAMDMADKAMNKAMSAAYKYACMQTFCIPTEGDNDADATTHEVVAKNNKIAPAQPRETARAKNQRWEQIKKELDETKTLEELQAVWAGNYTHIQAFDEELASNLEAIKDRKKAEFKADAATKAGMSQGFNEIQY